MKRIVTVTPNPALDITATVDRLTSGVKLRCREPRFDPGGGGVNVSRALSKLGGTSLPFVAVGGAIGDAVKALLKAEGIEAVWFDIEGQSRQSVVIDEQTSGEQYRFVLPGPAWSEEAWRKSLDIIGSLLQSDDLVVGSGSLPPGVPDDYYVRLAQIARDKAVCVLLDTSGRALSAIANNTSCTAAVLLMGEQEAIQLSGKNAADESTIYDLAEDLVKRGVAETVIATLGARGAIALNGHEAWRVAPATVKVESKVGAGDSFTAGLVLGFAQGWSLKQALINGMAAATSAVTTPATELCTRTGTDELRPAVTCVPL